MSKRASPGVPLRFMTDVVFAYSGDGCLIWPFARNSNGRGHVKIDGQMKSVHRLVCERVHGPPPSLEHEAAHSCGNGHLGCVAGSHVDWKTSAENEADKIVHGTHSRGERSPNAKLTEADVREIRRLEGSISQRAIARRFEVSRHNVQLILQRRTWAWIENRERNLP